MTTPEARVRAASRALAAQWAPTPDDIPKIAKTLEHDAWILENAGLLANPPQETP